ncbi:girdin isoform X2 [Pelobates cultripes]|uniref:Girdin isoform X2 n=1 Tax=Pelobates cultripes TaxID=61616 RepID=A0AAD1RIK8_PELCU|nr:girdin isoform X2 [Pelobates cultripes]
MRNRPKEKDKMKALYRRSVSMNDLVQSMVLAGGQWTGSAENLEGPDDVATGKRRNDLGSMAFSTTAINFSTLNPSMGFRPKLIPKSKDGTSYEDVSVHGANDDSYTVTTLPAPRPSSLDSGRTSYSNSNNNASIHEVTAGAILNQTRSQSHNSGDFNLHHDQEVFSNSNSPVQYFGHRLKKSAASSPMLKLKSYDNPESLTLSKHRLSSPGSEMVSLKQFLEESNKLTVSQIRSGSQENLLDEVMRSLSGSAESAGFQSPTQLSPGISLGERKTGKPEQCVRPNPRKAEDTRFTFPPTVNPQSSDEHYVLTHGAGSTQKQTKDSNPYATLPRASSVISTAEGTTRRTSIHDFLSKDNRSPISVDPSPTTEDAPSLLNVEATQEIRLSKSRSREQQTP